MQLYIPGTVTIGHLLDLHSIGLLLLSSICTSLALPFLLIAYNLTPFVLLQPLKGLQPLCTALLEKNNLPFIIYLNIFLVIAYTSWEIFKSIKISSKD